MPGMCSWQLYIYRSFSHAISAEGSETDQAGSEPRGGEHRVLTFKPVLEILCQLTKGFFLKRRFSVLMKTPCLC